MTGTLVPLRSSIRMSSSQTIRRSPLPPSFMSVTTSLSVSRRRFPAGFATGSVSIKAAAQLMSIELTMQAFVVFLARLAEARQLRPRLLTSSVPRLRMISIPRSLLQLSSMSVMSLRSVSRPRCQVPYVTGSVSIHSVSLNHREPADISGFCGVPGQACGQKEIATQAVQVDSPEITAAPELEHADIAERAPTKVSGRLRNWFGKIHRRVTYAFLTDNGRFLWCPRPGLRREDRSSDRGSRAWQRLRRHRRCSVRQAGG